MYKKIVNESLLEFQKGLDPVDSLFNDIQLGDLVTDKQPYKDYDEDHNITSYVNIFVVSKIFESEKEVDLYQFVEFYEINEEFENKDVYISGVNVYGTIKIDSIRKINIKEKQYIHNCDNFEEILKASNILEKRINKKNKTNIKIRL